VAASRHSSKILWLALALAPFAAGTPACAGTSLIYVTNSAGDSIHVIDAASNKVVQEIKGIEAAHGIAPAPDGTRVYVSSEATSTLDVFDRERAFIDRHLSKWIKRFPKLRFILEHLSSKDGVDFVKSAAPQVGGTITPYHMMLTRNDWFGHGLKPYMYVMPVIKTARDRTALRKAATSGEACYFLGTDSAPHPYARKVRDERAAGHGQAAGPGGRRGTGQ